MSIVVVGSVAFDTIETPVGKVDRVLGGSANYFSLASSFFTSVKMVGVVGSDFPQEHFDFLKSRNICTEGLQRVLDGNTFHWVGRYDATFADAETLSTQLNVFEHFSPNLPQTYRQSPYVFLGNIDPTLQAHVLEQVKKPKIVACDTMNFWIYGKKEELLKTLKMVDILIINETEAKELAEERNLVLAARKIRHLGPNILIVKRGEYGAMMFTGESVFSSPGYPLGRVVDPTGAGDTFAGGFMGYLAQSGYSFEEEHLRRAVVYGNTLASFVVEDFSFNRLREISLDHINARFKEFTAIASF
ncbi:MAG TPA: PfkB family carbohydrate kinase [Bdellovibrionota bacterium]|nr:PfkB family carbohydrate kinase [Bdellovibrionota bacterium]